MIFVLAFTTFIASHPGFMAWLIGGLVTVLAALIGAYYSLIYSELRKLEIEDAEISKRLRIVEGQLREYREHVGVGDRTMASLAKRIDAHMIEEETKVWKGIQDIHTKLTEMAVENVKAHSEIITSHGERLSRLEVRVDTILTNTKNGHRGRRP